MYDPVKDGVAKHVEHVSYREVAPSIDFDQLVHCYWELKTDVELAEDFTLHALPDACVNVLFDQVDTDIAGVTALQTEHTTLDLGRSFHYVGIQFYPGAWHDDPANSVDHYVGEAYAGDLPLKEVSASLAPHDFDDKLELLDRFVAQLVDKRVVGPNPVTAAILQNIDEITSVADMASVAFLSPRQLQRTLKATTGFSPHDLLKVLRIQHSFRQDYLLMFTDQAHYTHSFRKVTGYTPKRFNSSFDVGTP